MSAFMVEDKTINRIVTWLHTKWFLGSHPELKVEDDESMQEMGARMFQLNINAIEARYGKGRAKDFRDLDYDFQLEFSNIMQVYKSLTCFLYQCSEGDVPSKPLYKSLRAFEHSLAASIIARLPEYDKATWG